MEIDWSGVTVGDVDWQALCAVGEEVGQDFVTYGVPILVQAKDAAW